MNTRKKNKSAHPGIPDMTSSQLASAGLSHARNARRPPNKKPTKDQQIAALKNELRAAQELISSGRFNEGASQSSSTQTSLDTGGDTDPATDIDEVEIVAAGTKRKAAGLAGSTSKLKRSNAMDPFESSSMAHSSATGLIDDWRTRIASPRTTPSLESPSLDFQTPQSSISSTSMTSVSIPSLLSFEEAPLSTFILPRMIAGSKVYPGIKDLPPHIRQNFRNEFIRYVIRELANSQLPWINPDVNSLQSAYRAVYPLFPARLRHSDAVCHPTTTTIGVLRNHLGTAAVTAVQRHLPSLFRKKKLKTIEARARYIAELFQSKDDHPIIWREYVEGNIQNHHEVGGYKTTRRGVFQSDPILETILSYYSSSGIMEPIPTEDPGPGNRPLGILALATAAVERAYKMYTSGEYIESGQSFNAENWNLRTTRYMDYVVNDLGEKQWDAIFGALGTFSRQIVKEEAVRNSEPEDSSKRVPLPPSDPPSPPCND